MFDNLVASVKQLREAVKSGEFHAIRKAFESVVVSVNTILDAFSGAPGVLDADWEAKLAECDAVIEEMKATSVAPTASPAAAPALDPGTILIIIELATKLIEWIRKRRNP